jgi:hypothetical protein
MDTKKGRRMIDPKPNLSAAGIKANIDHYESRVQSAYDNWQQELMQLEYWLEQLDLLKETN